MEFPSGLSLPEVIRCPQAAFLVSSEKLPCPPHLSTLPMLVHFGLWWKPSADAIAVVRVVRTRFVSDCGVWRDGRRHAVIIAEHRVRCLCGCPALVQCSIELDTTDRYSSGFDFVYLVQSVTCSSSTCPAEGRLVVAVVLFGYGSGRLPEWNGYPRVEAGSVDLGRGAREYAYFSKLCPPSQPATERGLVVPFSFSNWV
jgi:hypothetical protein